MAKSTPKKPHKPHRDFPLTANGNGQWSKKIKGNVHYFGTWSNPDAALQRYLDVKDDLLAGRKPRSHQGDFTLRDLCNHFLTHKRQLLDSGELAPRTFDRLRNSCEFLLSRLGKDRAVDDISPHEFQTLRAQMAARWGPVALGNEIQIIRSVFNYGYEAVLLEKPMRFGPGFKKPSAKTLRQIRAAHGPRMFTPEQIHKVLKHSTTNLRAMVLLGINAGLGNTDLGELRTDLIDLESGWLDYPRPKTGMPRRVLLWPETLEALREVINARYTPKNSEDDALLFIGPRGENYIGNHKGYRVTAEMARTTAKVQINRTFYDLRRTFQTVAEGAHDLVAIRTIMGHAPASGDMAAIYRQSVEDDRLKAVVEHVRQWLFGKVAR